MAYKRRPTGRSMDMCTDMCTGMCTVPRPSEASNCLPRQNGTQNTGIKLLRINQ